MQPARFSIAALPRAFLADFALLSIRQSGRSVNRAGAKCRPNFHIGRKLG
jgi:hypothetical protein